MSVKNLRVILASLGDYEKSWMEMQGFTFSPTGETIHNTANPDDQHFEVFDLGVPDCASVLVHEYTDENGPCKVAAIVCPEQTLGATGFRIHLGRNCLSASDQGVVNLDRALFAAEERARNPFAALLGM